MPGSESESEVLDFAALAHSIRPAGPPVEAPGESTRKIVVEESKADAHTGVSWIWIAAGLGGILLGALGAIVIESQLQSETKNKVVATAEPAAMPTAPEAAQVVDAVEPAKPAAPAPAFVSVEETSEEKTDPARAENKELTKPATVVSTASREPKPDARKEPLSEAVSQPEKKKVVAEPPAAGSQEAELPKVEDEKEEPAVDLPAQPSREVVGQLLSGARPEMEACAAGRHGVATITLRVGSSGRVKSAIVDGAFQGSSEGSCMARVARKLRFPQFSEETFKVEYPYRL